MQIFYHLPCGDRFEVSSSVPAICAAMNMIDLFLKRFQVFLHSCLFVG